MKNRKQFDKDAKEGEVAFYENIAQAVVAAFRQLDKENRAAAGVEVKAPTAAQHRFLADNEKIEKL